MKKTYLALLIAALISAPTFSQEDTKEQQASKNFNEFKLNGLYLVLGAFDITYERSLNEESAFGLNVFLPIDEDVNDAINYYISPYYRFYFGEKYAAGFFLEGFGMLNSVEETTLINNGGIDLSTSKDNVTDFALGIGLGGKWVTNSGFIGELNLGFGRNLFNSDRLDDENEIIGKIGISLGYRF